MRGFRLFLFLLVGLLLGGGCSVVLAAAGTRSASAMGMGFNVRAPSNVAVSGFYDGIVPGFDWTYDHYSSADTKISRSANGSLGGAPLSGTASRVVSAANIAKVGVRLAKLAGPVGIGLSLLDLIWNPNTGQWEVSQQDQAEPATGREWKAGAVDTYHLTPILACENWVSLYASFGYNSPTVEMLSSTHGKCHMQRTGYPGDHTVDFSSRLGGCPVGSYIFEGQCLTSVPARPAVDQEIEDAIYTELVARGMSSDLARRLVEAGYAPDLLPGDGPSSTSGPSSIPGPSSTSTTQTAAGPVTSVTNVTYNMTYNNQTVNVTETSTTTKTNPDNTTETTTETKTPAPTTGEEPAPDVPPEQPPEFCELHPESIVCQQMDTPTEDKGDPVERTFSITPSGGFGGAGSCPADVGLDFLGQPLTWSYQPACDFFSGVRPAVVAMAWVAAILIALGGYRKGD